MSYHEVPILSEHLLATVVIVTGLMKISHAKNRISQHAIVAMGFVDCTVWKADSIIYAIQLIKSLASFEMMHALETGALLKDQKIHSMSPQSRQPPT